MKTPPPLPEAALLLRCRCVQLWQRLLREPAAALREQTKRSVSVNVTRRFGVTVGLSYWRLF